MVDLKNLWDKYRKHFGDAPQFDEDHKISDEKKGEAIACCIENDITTTELLNLSKTQEYIIDKLMILPPIEIRAFVKYDEKNMPFIDQELAPQLYATFETFKNDYKREHQKMVENTSVKTHCSVWDYLMDEDLDSEGSCKYGKLEQKSHI